MPVKKTKTKKRKVAKWRPRDNDRYYYILDDWGSWADSEWGDDIETDVSRYISGNCFRTAAQVVKALHRLKKMFERVSIAREKDLREDYADDIKARRQIPRNYAREDEYGDGERMPMYRGD